MEAALGMVPVVGVVALALRYRTLDRAQRERVAWPLLAAIFLVLLSVDDVFFSISGPLVIVLDLAEASFLVLLPASLGIGHRQARACSTSSARCAARSST